jgi:Rad3-related DNA helicase
MRLRPTQKKMKADLVELGRSPRNAVRFFEAPTGFGKTITTLMAAHEVAEATGQAVIVSTYSNLLVEQALKTVREWNLPAEDFAPVLGMTNYVSPGSLDGAVKAGQLPETALEWLEEDPGSGTVSELERHLIRAGIVPSDMLRELVGVSPSFKGDVPADLEDERVFYLQALENAQGAKVVLTNHNVVLTPLLYSAVNYLPEHRFLVLDEGHSFATAAQNFLSASFSPFRMRTACGRLATLCADRELKGLASSLGAMAERVGELGTSAAQAGSTAPLKITDGIVGKLKELFTTGTITVEAFRERPEAVHGRALSSAYWIMRREWEELESVYSRVKSEQAWTRRSAKLGRPTFMSQRDDAHRWLRHKLWKDLDRNVAIVSGTVLMYRPGQKDAFNRFACSSIGIYDPGADGEVTGKLRNPWCVQYPSPFDTAKNVQVNLVAPDFPWPVAAGFDDEQADLESGGWETWIQALGERVASIYLGGGREKTLVLLGAYKDVDGLVSFLEKKIDPSEVARAAPGKSAAQVAAGFSTGILVGSRQFWTGVDIPAVRHLVIGKLPFPALSDPRWNKGTESKNWSLYNWEAALMFRQGCGRLIRAVDQTGTIHLLDARVHKNYPGGLLNPKAWESWARGKMAISMF